MGQPHGLALRQLDLMANAAAEHTLGVFAGGRERGRRRESDNVTCPSRVLLPLHFSLVSAHALQQIKKKKERRRRSAHGLWASVYAHAGVHMHISLGMI